MKAKQRMTTIFLIAVFASVCDRADTGLLAQVAANQVVGGQDARMEHRLLSSAYSGYGAATAAAVNSGYEQSVVELTNLTRANQGLPPLKRVEPLDQAARYHATDMGEDSYFNHDSYDRIGGVLTYACSWSDRVASYYQVWSTIGENIAAGYPGPAIVVAEWMNSPGHRANILNEGFWEIGVGYYEGEGGDPKTWVQDFGRRVGIYPLILNLDAAFSATREVTVYIYGTWQQMRLKNDSGDWSAWQPFQSQFDWTIAGGPGIHTVTAELSNGTTTTTSSDTIESTAFPVPGDFNGDALSDAFLYNSTTGAWSEHFGSGIGFANITNGWWAAGWQITPADF
ncbi:MAG: hypothetical protein H6Q05_5009, partial [Acidobacteria bacterium]|nr:hypothetical protein [Acidobacteriota bacterium]